MVPAPLVKCVDGVKAVRVENRVYRVQMVNPVSLVLVHLVTTASTSDLVLTGNRVNRV